MNIVIVGAGKAGGLHFGAYAKLRADDPAVPSTIHFVDPRAALPEALPQRIHECGGEGRIHASLEDLMRACPHFRRENTIVDLCTPSGTFTSLLRKWSAAGFVNFIVEKPFIVFDDDPDDVATLLRGLRVVQIENYLHSKVHATIRSLMQKYALDTNIVVTNFSKNRMAESMLGRGFSGVRTPTVFEIEMPHQLYLSADLFGSLAEVYAAWATDMIDGDRRIPNHGEGVVVARSETGTLLVHYSSLTCDRVVRTIDVFFKQDFYLHGIYAPICEDLSGIQSGVILSSGTHVCERVMFEDDDNMLAMLTHAFRALASGAAGDLTPPSRMLEFSRTMRTIMSTPADQAAGISRVPHPELNVLQQWFLQMFDSGVSRHSESFLRLIDSIRLGRFTEAVAAVGR